MPEVLKYHLTAETKQFCLTNREIGCVNIGVYCANPDCREFLAILKQRNPKFVYIIVLVGKFFVKCNHCHRVHRYDQDRIEQISLNPNNIKLPGK